MRSVLKLSAKLVLLLSLLPVFFLGILILIYSVNVPYWDQWAIAQLFEKVHNSSLTFNDLIAQHNESRKFFPRLVFITVGYLTHYNVRYEMLFTFLLACLVSLNIYLISNLTIAGSRSKKLLIATISNLLIFNPIQWQNWLWGIQSVVFLPIACITTCIVLVYSSLKLKTKFLICICLSTISTFSYANGILCWVVTFPLLLLQSRKILTKNKKWLIFIWLITFTLNTILYFYNYKKPSNHPSFFEALAHSQKAIYYFFSFIGAPLGFGNTVEPIVIAPIIGLVTVLFFLTSCIYLLKYLTNSSLLDDMAGWLAIGMYTTLSATITTLGRVGFGVEQSLDSRYTTFSTYLFVSVVYLIIIITDDIKQKYNFLRSKKLIDLVKLLLTIIILVLYSLTSIDAIHKMRDTRISRLQGKSCLLFINVVIEKECLTKNIYPEINYFKHTANFLNDLGFLKPGLVKSSNIRDIEGASKLGSESYGWFDNLTKVGTNLYVASGWAVLPERGEPADAVVLTYENANGGSTVFTVVDDTKNTRDDVAKALKNKSYSNSGWQKSFSSISLPKEAMKISAWAFDAKTGKAFKLNGAHIIKAKSPDNTALSIKGNQ